MKVIVVGFCMVIAGLAMHGLPSQVLFQDEVLKVFAGFGFLLMLAGWLEVWEEDNKTRG